MPSLRPHLLAAAILSVGLAACQPQTAPADSKATATAPASDAALDARFTEVSQQWLDGWLRLNPVAATQIGKHDFDGEVDDLSAAGRQAQVDFSKKILAQLDGIDTAKLSRENQIDALILRNQVRGDLGLDGDHGHVVGDHIV